MCRGRGTFPLPLAYGDVTRKGFTMIHNETTYGNAREHAKRDRRDARRARERMRDELRTMGMRRGDAFDIPPEWDNAVRETIDNGTRDVNA